MEGQSVSIFWELCRTRFAEIRHRLNPLHWSNRTFRTVLVSFFAIFLPLYLYIGLQPALPVGAESLPTLEIPSLSLSTPVASLELKDRELETPAAIAGAFSLYPGKTLIIGHSSTVFRQLHRLSEDASFTYDGRRYRVAKIETLEKSVISMNEILAPTGRGTIIIMTCAGAPLPNQDATHRLLVTAELID